MKRHPRNPLITRRDIVSSHPALRDVSSVFNPGGTWFEGRILLLLRVQNRARETLFVKAWSENGVDFQVQGEPLPVLGLEACLHRIFHIYDPRITLLDGIYHVICAVDTDQGCFLGWFTTPDFASLDFRGLVSPANTRNGVFFPEKIDGRYFRFERPNTVMMGDGVKTGSRILCSSSENLLNWSAGEELFSGRPHYWDELIGSGPPPLKTKQGWLHIFHGVATHFGSANIYQAGVSLHDLKHPWVTLARGKYNILEPREIYELCGQVPNVVFPTAALPLQTDSRGCLAPNSEVYVYYGAADTCVCLAVTTVQELLEAVYAP
ncbi:MAG: glycoside hydrolase family 130 protein [Candidatus Cloacimonetes bacterium]|nr:glycoside hydrolase family 130 protein [Candidatus Cloacimonadota bacterium]